MTEVNGVAWFLDETDEAFVFSTFGRRVVVQLAVPTSVPREEATAPLPRLAQPVQEAIPLTRH